MTDSCHVFYVTIKTNRSITLTRRILYEELKKREKGGFDLKC